MKEEKKPKPGKLDTWRGPKKPRRLGADQTKKRRAAPAGAGAQA